MDGIARTPRRTEASYQFWLGLTLTLLGAGSLLANRTEASAIIHSAKIDKAAVGSSWSEYLLGGPSVWDKVPHPPVTETVKHEIRKALRTDPDGTAPMVQFLLWRQSVDPARFDHYHPHLVRPLSKFKTPTTTPTTTTGAQVVTPSSTTLPTEAQTTGGASPQTVPEPEALLLAIGMAGWAVWWRRRLS